MIQEKPILAALCWTDHSGTEREIHFEIPDGPERAAIDAEFATLTDAWNATESGRRASENPKMPIEDIAPEDRPAFEAYMLFHTRKAKECIRAYKVGDESIDGDAARAHIEAYPRRHEEVIPELVRRTFAAHAWGDNAPTFTVKAPQPSGRA